MVVFDSEVLWEWRRASAEQNLAALCRPAKWPKVILGDSLFEEESYRFFFIDGFGSTPPSSFLTSSLFLLQTSA